MKNTQPDFDFPPDPEKPESVITETAEEYFRWVRKASDGRVIIETIERVSKHNGCWKLRLRWP